MGNGSTLRCIHLKLWVQLLSCSYHLVVRPTVLAKLAKEVVDDPVVLKAA